MTCIMAWKFRMCMCTIRNHFKYFLKMLKNVRRIWTTIVRNRFKMSTMPITGVLLEFLGNLQFNLNASKKGNKMHFRGRFDIGIKKKSFRDSKIRTKKSEEKAMNLQEIMSEQKFFGKKA